MSYAAAAARGVPLAGTYNAQSIKQPPAQTQRKVIMNIRDPLTIQSLRAMNPSNLNMTVMGKKNKRVDKYYLIKRRFKGEDAGIFANHAMKTYPNVWNVPPQIRVRLQAQWNRTIFGERVAEISTLADKYNKCPAQIDQLFRQKNFHVLGQKRIIGCTTTAAAMYTDEIRRASPGIVLVEEAGEILESHILTALTPTTKQLILIGDHKQLRPKVNNYALTLEKGDGYDLNVSLFERLVPSGVLITPSASSIECALRSRLLSEHSPIRSWKMLRRLKVNRIYADFKATSYLCHIDVLNLTQSRSPTVVMVTQIPVRRTCIRLRWC
jgi:hypothetical protein